MLGKTPKYVGLTEPRATAIFRKRQRQYRLLIFCFPAYLRHVAMIFGVGDTRRRRYDIVPIFFFYRRRALHIIAAAHRSGTNGYIRYDIVYAVYLFYIFNDALRSPRSDFLPRGRLTRRRHVNLLHLQLIVS